MGRSQGRGFVDISKLGNWWINPTSTHPCFSPVRSLFPFLRKQLWTKGSSAFQDSHKISFTPLQRRGGGGSLCPGWGKEEQEGLEEGKWFLVLAGMGWGGFAELQSCRTGLQTWALRDSLQRGNFGQKFIVRD